MDLVTSLIFCAINFLVLSNVSAAHRKQDWWETTLMYQVYPRSFKDSNGDGIGDLNGITEKLDYLKDIGVETIWIQPIFKSPMADTGYDISDYKAIDPMFGTLDDYKRLAKGIHDRGMKVILDYVPNHTSDEHEWFKLSERRVEPYTDFYVWKNAKKINDTYSTYPNNWQSIFEEASAWAWSDRRNQYYYHVFSTKQPELNFRNPKVHDAMNDVLRYWMDLGTDGFRVDAAKWLVEAEDFGDEEPYPGAPDPPRFFDLRHTKTIEQPENFELTHEWRMTLDEYAKKDGQSRLLTVEDFGSPKYLAQYLGNSTYPNVQMPFYFRFKLLNFMANSTLIHDAVKGWMDVMTEGNSPNWVIDSHDQPRCGTRYGPEMIDSFNMITLLLPGITSVYYGHEIGMRDSLIRPDQRQDPTGRNVKDPSTRDVARTPMQWDDTKNAGFTSKHTPWLPVDPNYWRLNVKSELQDPNSHLSIFKRLVSLRKTPLIKLGLLKTYIVSEWVFMFTRSLDDKMVAVIINLGSETERICAKNTEPLLPDTMVVHTGSQHSGYKIGDKVRLMESESHGCSPLRPKASLVLAQSASAVLSHSSYLLLVTIGFNLFFKTGLN